MLAISWIHQGEPAYPSILPSLLGKDAPLRVATLGNLDLLKEKPLALFCSVKCPGNLILQTYDLAQSLRQAGVTVIGGFHSPMERECLTILLRGTQPVIVCLARRLEGMRMPAEYRQPSEAGRLLLVSPFNGKDRRVTEETALLRNRFVGALADAIFVAHAEPQSKTEQFCHEILKWRKTLYTLDAKANENLLAMGAKPMPDFTSTWPHAHPGDVALCPGIFRNTCCVGRSSCPARASDLTHGNDCAYNLAAFVTKRHIQTDRRDIPSYGIMEAAHYLRVPPATIRDWVSGRYYPTTAGKQFARPIIHLPDPERKVLSFMNLVEVHVLDAIRREYKIPLDKVRRALNYLSKLLPSPHPLADREFETDGMDLFIQKVDELINLSQDGQLAMRSLLEAHLRRIERDASGIPIKLYPFTRKGEPEQPKAVVIDPQVSFGRPVLVGTGIATAIIAERYKAGESMEALAEDYGRPPIEIQEAIRCELIEVAA